MADTFSAGLIKSQEIAQMVTNSSDYAFLHSSCYQQIAGKKKYEQDTNDCDLYVCVSYGEKKIYLKYHSAPVPKNKVLLTYSNFARLGLKGGEDITVKIKKSCSFLYSWNNGDSAARLNFRVALVSLIIGIMSIIISFI